MIIQGDALHIPLKNEAVQCCVTSPPYFGLRNYNVEGQLGLEKTPDEYIANMVQVFREVKRVLRKDGCVWINIGDSYARDGGAVKKPGSTSQCPESQSHDLRKKSRALEINLKPKDLIGIPWMLAFALRADGWWLRQDIIWEKPNPMPESVRDRCTKAHEYVFLLTKSAKYYYDADAIKEPIKDSSVARLIQDVENQDGSVRVPGKTNGNMKAVRFGGNKQCPDTRLQSGKEWNPTMAGGGTSYKNGHSGYFDKEGNPLCGVMCNKKSVWSITTKGFKGAHFAVMPEKLVEPCILAGSKTGDVVLDPFAGSCTVGKVAERHGRKFVGIELNWEYITIGKKRMAMNQARLI